MAEYIERGTAIAKLTALEVIEPSATMTDAKRLLADMPAADVVSVVHGRWIATHDEFCSCSLCKYPVYVAWGQTNYCPNCGTKMNLEEEK